MKRVSRSVVVFVAIVTIMGTVQCKTYGGLAAELKGSDSIMQKKAHGTCNSSVQGDLRWGCDFNTADRICCFNRCEPPSYAGD